MITIRFILLVSTLSTLFSCSNATQPKTAIVNGKANFKNKWLYLVQPDPWLVKTNIVDSSLIDADGNFSFNADIPQMGEYLISGRGFFITNVFIENGMELNVSIAGTNKKRQVAFDGNNSEINNFWFKFSNRFYKQGGYGKKYKTLVSENEPLQFQKAYSVYAKLQMSVIDSFLKAAKPSKYFSNWASSFVEYSTISKNFTYLFHKPRFNRANGYMKVGNDYYQFLKDIDITKKPLAYHSAFNDFVYFFMIDRKSKNPDSWQEHMEYAKNELPERVANIGAAHLIKDLMQAATTRSDYDNLKSMIAEFKTWPNNNKYVEFIELAFADKAVLAPGSKAPDFTFQDVDGNEVSISDFVGKVVVLDFWGTWCGPCKRELPYSRKIEEYYAANTDDVVFVFVALEKGSRAYWKDFVVSNDLPGIHLYSSSGDRSLMNYKITSVPRYVLIDKEGNIYDAFASRPSQNMQAQIAKVLAL
ncbi:MAG: TlpA family protein disulfide reductase [Bacteroidia bacterium]